MILTDENPAEAPNKLPAITAAFWLMKICATTLGETAGDLLSMTLHAGYAVSSVILFCSFLVLLSLQLHTKRYRPLIYWSLILATSTAGTTMSDFMDRTLGLGYASGSAILLILLVSTLCIWKYFEKTLSVTGVQTKRGEIFYWTAILFSNTLGTALGDFLADNSGLGFTGGAVLIGCTLIVIALGYFFTKISRIVLFWLAFILTRPFGAGFGDMLTKSQEKGGLNFGTIGSSAILAGILFCMIIGSARRNKFTQNHIS